MNIAMIPLVLLLATAPQPCSTPEHHALDFWVGEWEVKDARSGTVVGASSVQSILDGCVVFENWTGRRGMTGKSFNTFNPATKLWKQSWVDSTGGAFDFTGEASPGRLVYTRELVNAEGKPMKNRMTLSKRDDGTVHQFSEMSSDGKTWTPAYYFIYVKR